MRPSSSIRVSGSKDSIINSRLSLTSSYKKRQRHAMGGWWNMATAAALAVVCVAFINENAHNNNHFCGVSALSTFSTKRTIAPLTLLSAKVDNNEKTARKSSIPPSRSSSSSDNNNSNNEENHYQLQVGRALDTLRQDYPRILTESPNFSIYDTNIEVVDPSGVKVHGLKSYKSAFHVLHALVRCIYCSDQSGLTFRMCYDKARENIRIHWHAEVVPRRVFGGVRSTLYIDGISVYEICKTTGQITQHRIETLLINDAHVRPEEGVIAALYQEHGVSVPSFIQAYTNNVVEFSTKPTLPGSSLRNSGVTSLFAVESSAKHDGSSSTSSSSSSNNSASNNNDEDNYPGLDWMAFESKNKSRLKFGLKPLSPEEFMALDTQVQRMDAVQRQRAATESAAAAAQKEQAKKEKENGNFWDNLLGNVLQQDTCESNYDCERPLVCCDFGFVQKCCASGNMVKSELRPALIPVPVEVNFPGMDGPSRRY